MTKLTDDLQSTFTDIMDEFGEDITITRTTTDSYDVDTATASSSTSSESGHGVPTDYDRNEIDGSLVRSQDVKLFVNAVNTEPLPNDTVNLRGTDYKTVSVRRHSVSGANIIYELQLRV